MKHGRYEQQKPKKRMTAGKIVLIIVAILLVVVIAAVIFGITTYKSMLDQVTIVTMPTQYTTEAAITEAVETTVANTEETVVDTEATTVETTVPPMKPEDILNILVVGQSGRAGEAAALADTMILVSINKYTKELTLTSFLRDTYVDLPDYRDSRGTLHPCGWNKLTTCYALGYSWGGTGDAMAMVNMCLENNFGVEVDYNIEINFESLIRVVDLMGGVELEITQAEADYLNADNYDNGMVFAEGWASLDGTDALSYARMRKAEGDNDSDIIRTSRQRYMLEMLLRKLKMLSLADMQNIANEVLPMITTNMPANKITESLLEILPMLTSLSVQNGTCPVETTYWSELKDTPDGTQYVLVFDKGQNVKLMRAITEGEIAE